MSPRPTLPTVSLDVADCVGVESHGRSSCGKDRVTPIWHDGYMSSIELPEVADLEGLAPRELGRILSELDGVRRRVEALIVEAVGVADRTVAYAEDGHASVSGWVKATCNTSKADTKSMVQCSRLLQAIPEARLRRRPARLGVAQLRLLAEVHANPRCADQFAASAESLVGHARSVVVRRVPDRGRAVADAG